MRWMMGFCFSILAMPVNAWTDQELTDAFSSINETLISIDERLTVFEDDAVEQPIDTPIDQPIDPPIGDEPFTYTAGGNDRDGSSGWESIYWIPEIDRVTTFFGFSHMPTNNNTVRLYDPAAEVLTYLTDDTGPLWDNVSKVWTDTGDYRARCTQRDNSLHWYFPNGDIWTMIGPGGGIEYCNYNLTATGDSGWTDVVMATNYGGGGQAEFFQRMGVTKQNTVTFGINSAMVSNCGGKWLGIGGGNGASDVFHILEPTGIDTYLIRQEHLPFGPRTRARNSAVCVDDQYVYYHGGMDAAKVYHNDLWRYDVAAGTWTELTSGGLAAHYPTMTYDPTINALMTYGGTVDGAVANNLWLYFIDQDRWVDLAEWAKAKGVSMVKLGRAVYVPGKGHLTVGGVRYDVNDGTHKSIQDDMQFRTITFDPAINVPGWLPGSPPPPVVDVPPVVPPVVDPDIDLNHPLAFQRMVDATPEGGVLTVPPGHYELGALIPRSITINLEGVTIGKVVNQKAFLNVDCTNNPGCEVHLNGLSMDATGTNCIYDNFAFVKFTGINWKGSVTNFDTVGCNVSILTDNRGGDLTIKDSTFRRVGKAYGMTHGIYLGKIDRAHIENVHLPEYRGGGHILKSRAQTMTVKNSSFDGRVIDPSDSRSGAMARMLDYPCGGDITVTNSKFFGSERTSNADFFAVGTEPISCGGTIYPTSFSMHGTLIQSERDRSDDEKYKGAGVSRLFNWKAPVVTMDVTDNLIAIRNLDDNYNRFIWATQEDIPDQLDQNTLCAIGDGCGE